MDIAIIPDMIEEYVIESSASYKTEVQEQFPQLLLSKANQKEIISPDLSIYEIIPVKLGHNYKIEIFDSFSEISPHYHKIQTQIIVGLEGRAKIDTINEEFILEPGTIITIPPGIVHGIVPTKKARFIAIDFPGFNYPQDVIPAVTPRLARGIQKKAWILAPGAGMTTGAAAIISDEAELAEIPEGYYLRKIQEEGYTVYELAGSLDKTWSIAILDIMNAPRHFHKNGIECFLVLSGELTIECDGLIKRLKAGQSIAIAPGIAHHLHSESDRPARVLCLNFPAFDENDFYLKPTVSSL